MKVFFDFWRLFFRTYDITTEVVMLSLIIVMHVIIRFTKPEKTYMLKLFFCGMGFCFLTMVLHIWLLAETLLIDESGSLVRFNIVYLLFSVCFIMVQVCIFSYQTQLSYKRRSHRLHIRHMCGAFMLVWLFMMLIPLINGTLLDYADGRYILSKESDVYILVSLTCAMLVVAVTYANRKDVSRIVFWGSVIFLPLEICGVIAQLYFHTAYFICATFTIPYVIYLSLFHVNKYDEVTGCQGFSAYRSLVKRYLKENQDFVQISLYAPKLEARDFAEIEDLVVYICNGMSRDIEKIHPWVKVFSLASYEYIIVCPVYTDQEAELVTRTFIKILSRPSSKDGRLYKTPINFLVSRNFKCIENVSEHIALLNLCNKKFHSHGMDQIITVTEEDARNYKRRALIERNLLDIMHTNNLDDERVVVYVQPIYSISENDYRTGESLMRLRIDDEMFYPDEFIPIAENAGCIHSLTRIMLNKIAKKTVAMKNNCDFDALTVNVSTVELMDPDVSHEFLNIIRRVNADPKKIRLEITESTAITDYGMVIANMTRMNQMGIDFYLDDFGTGYSNLDRVISMPFTTVKFDKSLMYKSMEDAKTRELLMFLVRFFKEKGFSLVVEGVETETQRDFVKAVDFDYIQGYLYSRPVPEAEAEYFYL